MKRLLLVVLITAGTFGAYAQDAEQRAEETPAESEHGGMEAWKWANFALLAVGLGYLIQKNAGPFFAARSKKIQQDMQDAEEARKDAEKRAADVDRRLANLDAEIASLKAESQSEAKAETERSMQHTTAEIAKIQAHAEREIAAAGKAARMELKRYSAQLAVELAEQKISARMSGEAQDNLVRGFVHDLKHPAS